MIICGCGIEAKYQLRLMEEQKRKPYYAKDRIGKYTRRQNEKEKAEKENKTAAEKA